MAAHGFHGASSIVDWLSTLEVPLFLTAVALAFLTARALRSGVFGTGMALLAVGFLVMAVGHGNMLLDRFFGVDLITALFGETIGPYAWVAALMLSWGLSGIGLYRIYLAARGSRTRQRT